MYGSYDWKTNTFECVGMTNVHLGNTDVYYAGNLFLSSGDEKNKLSEIADTYKNTQIFNGLSGQFAFVIHDKNEQKILLTRDQLGVYPFYYTLENDIVLFGTNITSILQNRKKTARVNRKVIHEYFMYRYISGENTIFKDIHEIQPGTAIEIDHKGSISENKYYRFNYLNTCSNISNSYAENFKTAFRESLIKQLNDKAVKHIGVLSSGGIDSSILVSGTNKIYNHKFNTYYIENEGYKFNRIQEVEYLSELFNTNHRNLIVSGMQFSEHLEETIRINEEPLNHPSTVQRNLLNQAIKNEVDVLISGEGADCLFCGYYIFDIIDYGYVKNFIRPISGSLAKMIPVHLFPEGLSENIEKILQALILPPHEYTMHYSEMCSNRYDTVSQLLDLDCPDDFMKNYKKILSNYTPNNILEIILSIYQSYYLVEGLNTITKIGEASGIEFRHPFIDIDLINLFNQFPWKEKKRFFKRKHQVVELGKQYLPKQFFQKRKEGFGVPLKTWFGNEKGLGRYVGLLNDSKTRERGIFNVNYLDQLLTQYRKKELIDSAYERILWPIINLELWHRIFIDNKPTGYK